VPTLRGRSHAEAGTELRRLRVRDGHGVPVGTDGEEAAGHIGWGTSGGPAAGRGSAGQGDVRSVRGGFVIAAEHSRRCCQGLRACSDHRLDHHELTPDTPETIPRDLLLASSESHRFANDGGSQDGKAGTSGSHAGTRSAGTVLTRTSPMRNCVRSRVTVSVLHKCINHTRLKAAQLTVTSELAAGVGRCFFKIDLRPPAVDAPPVDRPVLGLLVSAKATDFLRPRRGSLVSAGMDGRVVNSWGP